jgi:DNA-binding transcriptional regulator YiaG
MSSIAKVLKTEIQRIVHREISRMTASQKQGLAVLKKANAEYKRRLAALEKMAKQQSSIAQCSAGVEPPVAGASEDVRVTAKALKSMRKRLDITQAELAKLLGVSVQVVSIWETKKGRVQIRKEKVRSALAALKQEKKDAVCARLGKDVIKKKSARAGAQPAPAISGPAMSMDGAGIAKLRSRLSVSQHDFARLAGVSNQIVSVWERKKGALQLRANTARQLNAVVKMSKAEAKRRLG